MWSRDKAREHYRQERFKLELVEAIPDGEEVSFYRQGDFLDLCRGPHMRHTGDTGAAFRLTHVAGSYWRGDSSQPQLQRIYGTAWRTPGELKNYFKMLKKPSAATIDDWGVKWACFICKKKRLAWLFGTTKDGRYTDSWNPIFVAVSVLPVTMKSKRHSWWNASCGRIRTLGKISPTHVYRRKRRRVARIFR